ncbi:hypothetical protein H0H93_000326, partial [Arthromyces matolae]
MPRLGRPATRQPVAPGVNPASHPVGGEVNWGELSGDTTHQPLTTGMNVASHPVGGGDTVKWREQMTQVQTINDQALEEARKIWPPDNPKVISDMARIITTEILSITKHGGAKKFEETKKLRPDDVKIPPGERERYQQLEKA